MREESNYPCQYEPVATVELTAGEHAVETVRGGGSLLPATGNELAMEGSIARIGPLVLAPVDPPPPVRMADEEAMQACAGEDAWGWAEVVVSSGTSPGRF